LPLTAFKAVNMVRQVLSHNTPRWLLVFEITSTVIMVALAGAIVWQGRRLLYNTSRVGPPPPVQSVPRHPVAIGTDNVRGARSAHVAIIEYADFGCSSCAEFAANVEPSLLREYVDTGRVLFAFKHFPLAIHPDARTAARAAACAAKQGKFWQAHDRFYEVLKQSHKLALQDVAHDVGLDLSLYNTCLTGTEAEQQVQTDRAQGEALNVWGTPTFFVGTLTAEGRVDVTDAILGSRSLQEFREILDRLLEK